MRTSSTTFNIEGEAFFVLCLPVSHWPASLHATRFEQVRANMAVQDREETRNMRWKAHDTAQLITGLGVRKVCMKLENCACVCFMHEKKT